jgi:hypothetical protein
MSEQNPVNRAERASEGASERESAVSIKQAGELAERVTQLHDNTQREADFRKRADEFVLALSKDVQFGVNAFNRNVVDGTRVDAPAPLEGELGFTITKRTCVASANDSRLRYPEGQVHTSVEVSIKGRRLNVFHVYPMLHGSNALVSMAQASKRDSYALELDAEGQIVAINDKKRVTQNEIAMRICVPLFEYVESAL